MTPEIKNGPLPAQVVTVDQIDVSALEVLGQEVVTAAQVAEINVPADLEGVDAILVRMAQAIGTIETALKPMRDSTTAAWRTGTQLEKALLDRLREAKGALGSRRAEIAAKFETEREAARIAEEKRLQLAAEEEALVAAAAAEEAAKELEEIAEAAGEAASGRLDEGDVNGASNLMEGARDALDGAYAAREQAEAIVAKPIEIYLDPGFGGEIKKTGVSTQTRYSAEVVNLNLLILAASKDPRLAIYLKADLPALNKAAPTLAPLGTQVPGVKFIKTLTSAVSKGPARPYGHEFGRGA